MSGWVEGKETGKERENPVGGGGRVDEGWIDGWIDG